MITLGSETENTSYKFCQEERHTDTNCQQWLKWRIIIVVIQDLSPLTGSWRVIKWVKDLWITEQGQEMKLIRLTLHGPIFFCRFSGHY